MASANDDQIKVSLACAQQFKTNVCRTAEEFKQLRTRLLQSLETIKSTNRQNDAKCSQTTTDPNGSLNDGGDINNLFQQITDAMIDEHATMIRPSLVLFGPNSSGKTSFIQRFLGIGDILPADFGPITARIVQFTYAPSEQACARVYDTMEKTSIQCKIELCSFFENQLEPNWEGIAGVLLPHVQRPTNINENSAEFHEWAKCFVEIALPSDVLSLGIDVYDTPGFLSNNREQVLTDNLHKLVKRSKPTLLFLYDNATISDTDKSCFLAMKNALGSMERVSTFFLNTKADCISIANDYLLDDDPENISLDEFVNVLHTKREHCYELLLRRREMASEILGSPPDCVDECTFFDICTIPKGFDLWEKYTNLINVATFQRIIKFAVESYSASTLVVAQDILATVNDYFDLVVSTTIRLPSQWDSLRKEAIQWGCQFFDEYEKLLPTLTDELTTNILQLFEELKPQIARQAALIVRADDPIDTLLQDNAKSVRDYIRLAIQEQVIKVAANNLIINTRDQIKDLINNHYQQQRGQRKNELLAISQRQVLGGISAETLQKTDDFGSFLHNLIQIPMRLSRFWLSLPTRLSAYRKDLCNRFVQAKIKNGDVADVYKLLDAMDAYATLSNEESRKKFADCCLQDMENELKEKKETFGNNLIAWVKMQRDAFNKNIELNYGYIQMHSNNQQILHNLIRKFSGLFAIIECQLLAAMELTKRNGLVPILREELGRGGFYDVYAAQWGSEDKLAVKKLLDPTVEYVRMAALEAHYHRVVTLLHSDYIAPLRYIYENNINDNQKELWLIMPRYPKSLRQYLMRHIHEIEFPRAVSFALIIATTLADLHRIEVVHRDLKTSNIMLDENEQCYIIDFGTARFGLANTTLVGTLPLPPEIFEAHFKNGAGFTNYDGTAADIYSFGLILYEMLPKRSYERLDTESLTRLEELITSYTQLDTNMRIYGNQIRACLDPNPAQRPSATQLVENLKLIQQRTEIKPCRICDDKDRGIRFVPCGHKITCAQCWETWSTSPTGNRQCILCKAIVTNYTVDNSNATFFIQ